MNKTKHRTSLTDENFKVILKTCTTNMATEYDKLLVDKKCNVSH